MFLAMVWAWAILLECDATSIDWRGGWTRWICCARGFIRLKWCGEWERIGSRLTGGRDSWNKAAGGRCARRAGQGVNHG